MLGEIVLLWFFVYYFESLAESGEIFLRLMGVVPSVHERLLEAVVKQDWQAVEKCRREGADLEFRDRREMTALMIACSIERSHNVIDTLLRLGARMDAYKRGSSGGFPMHIAARKGLHRAVKRLLEAGASPNVLNDDGKTPLSIAREKGYAKVVRVIEEHVAAFRGYLKGQAVATGIMGLLPNALLAKTWYIVAAPVQEDPHLRLDYELLMYTSEKQPVPKVEIQLTGAFLRMEKEDTSDPVVIICDSTGSKKFKFSSKDIPRGDTVIRQLYEACSVLGTRIEPQGQGAEGPPAPLAQAPLPPGPPHPPHQMTYMAPPESVYPPLATPAPPPGFLVNDAAFPSHPTQVPTTSFYTPIFQPPKMADGQEAFREGQESWWQRPSTGRFLTPLFKPDGRDGGWVPQPEGEFNGWDSDWAKQEPTTSSETNRRMPDREFNEWGSDLGKQEPATSSEMDRRMSDRYNGWGDSSVLHSDWAYSQRVSVCPDSKEQRGEEPRFQNRRGRSSPVDNEDVSPDGVLEETAPSAPPLPHDYDDGSPSVRVQGQKSKESERHGSRKGEHSRKTDGICPICMDNSADAVCVPCGHVAGCFSCLSDVRSRNMGCPVCRADIREVIRVFKV